MEEEKLVEMYELTKENNKMLHAMRRNARIAGIFKAIFWVLILFVIPYISWLYVQPYVTDALKTYNSVKTTTSSVQAAGSANLSGIQKFFQQFGGGGTK